MYGSGVLAGREARGVAQLTRPGRLSLPESTGVESRRTDAAGVVDPPARLGTAARADASRPASTPCRASLYGLAMGLVLSASQGWPWVAAFAAAAGPWCGWRLARRA